MGLVVACVSMPVEAQAPPLWRLAAPHFEVGGFEAEGEYQLASLGGVTVLQNGNVVLGDRVAPFLKVFSSTGEFIRQMGSAGQGPGEYQYVYEFDWCADGQLSVFDADRRVHRYTAEMQFVRTDLVSLEAIGGGVGYNRDCHPNGLQIVTGWGNTREQFKVGLYEATAPVMLLRGQDVIHDFGEWLSSQRVGNLRPDGSPAGSGPHPFGRATVVALGSDRVYIGDGEDYEIGVYDLVGEALPPVRWSGPELDYDEQLVQTLRDEALADAPERSRAGLRRWYDELPELNQVPAYDRILVSATDELWVRAFGRPGSVGEEWTIFDRRGAIVGHLGLPERSTLWEARADQVVYSTLDQLDVPIVRISRIQR